MNQRFEYYVNNLHIQCFNYNLYFITILMCVVEGNICLHFMYPFW